MSAPLGALKGGDRRNLVSSSNSDPQFRHRGSMAEDQVRSLALLG